jgi:hypothetical protein
MDGAGEGVGILGNFMIVDHRLIYPSLLNRLTARMSFEAASNVVKADAQTLDYSGQLRQSDYVLES